MSGKIVKFKSGANRSAENLFDPSGFISPAVLRSFSRYMERHRIKKDGKTRASDNWQKGTPTSRALRSLVRHFLDLWLMSRGYAPESQDCKSPEDALHALLFNVSVVLKNRLDGAHHEAAGEMVSWWSEPRNDGAFYVPTLFADAIRKMALSEDRAFMRLPRKPMPRKPRKPRKVKR